MKCIKQSLVAHYDGMSACCPGMSPRYVAQVAAGARCDMESCCARFGLYCEVDYSKLFWLKLTNSDNNDRIIISSCYFHSFFYE